jgi:DNA-binding transcriptional MerR regulator
VDDKHMQIGEVAARTELSLRTIRHYEETGLVIPSARSQGGFRLYTENDVARLMVIRRMKPLGFTLEQMRDLLDATDRLDSDGALGTGEREALLERVRTYRQAAAEQVEKLRVQLERAEDFANTLGARLEQNALAARVDAGENIKALSAYLGHGDPGFTLRTYTHLMPSSEGRTRKAVDHMYEAAPSAPDGPQTAQSL